LIQLYKLFENLFFSDDDQYHRFDDWINNKENILIIIGIAGSGKTTLGQDLAIAHNAKYIQTDKHFLKYHKIFKNENGRRANNNEIDVFVPKIVYDIEHDIINNKEKSVWEGVWLLNDIKFITKYSFIIKNTSQCKSLYRTIIRDINRGKQRTLPDWIDSSLHYIMTNINYDKKLNELKLYLKGK